MFEIVESGVMSPDFCLEIARWNVKWMTFHHVNWFADVWATPVNIVEYQIPAWKTWYVTQWKMSTWQWKEVFVQFQYSANGTDWMNAHSLLCFETNYDYKFTVPLKMHEWYHLRVIWTDWATHAKTSAAFDIILIDNSIE